MNNALLEAALQGLEAQKSKLEDQIKEVRQMLGVRGPRKTASAAAPVTGTAPTKRTRRPLSAAARKRIAAAQKRRWAEYRKGEESGPKPAKKAASKKAAAKATKEA